MSCSDRLCVKTVKKNIQVKDLIRFLDNGRFKHGTKNLATHCIVQCTLYNRELKGNYHVLWNYSNSVSEKWRRFFCIQFYRMTINFHIKHTKFVFNEGIIVTYGRYCGEILILWCPSLKSVCVCVNLSFKSNIWVQKAYS